MKIVSLNVRHGGGSRLVSIIDRLKQYNSDVIVLTEFRNNKNADLIVRIAYSRSGSMPGGT